MWCYVGQMFQLCSCCVLIVHIYLLYLIRVDPIRQTSTNNQNVCFKHDTRTPIIFRWFYVSISISLICTHWHSIGFNFPICFFFANWKLFWYWINAIENNEMHSYIFFPCLWCSCSCSNVNCAKNWMTTFVRIASQFPIEFRCLFSTTWQFSIQSFGIIIGSYCQQPCSEKKLIHNNNNSWNRRMSASAPSHGCERMKLLFVFDF